MNVYGKDVGSMFLPDPKDFYTDALPTLYKDAADFKRDIEIDHSRFTQMLGVLEDIYKLNNLDTTWGVYLDLRGIEVGAVRDGRSDAEYIAYIRVIMKLNKLNSGTIPDIKTFIKYIFGNDYAKHIPVVDNKDGSVTVSLPDSLPYYMLRAFADVAASLPAAGIQLKVIYESTVSMGMVVLAEPTHVTLEDNAIARFHKYRRLSAGKRFAAYASRTSAGAVVGADLLPEASAPDLNKAKVSAVKVSAGKKVFIYESDVAMSAKVNKD